MRVRATVAQTPSPSHLQAEAAELEVEGGRIIAVNAASERSAHAHDGSEIIDLPDDWVLVPGLIDTHLHAPQWPQLGTGLDLPLDQWLFENTFPLEARFADTDFAARTWADMVPTLLAGGTTTAVYYGSTHLEATLALAEQCRDRGQRAFIGRVAMDHPDGTPDFYRDGSPREAIDLTRQAIDGIRAIDGGSGLVEPMVTPRFIPACTDDTLRGLGELAASEQVRVQTHCSEGDWQHAHVFERCGVSDATALDDFGLLRDHAVLAHGTHLSPADRTRLIGRGAGVAHCPLSNAYFANAVFPTRRNLDAGLRIGLGTDVAGGATSNMFEQCAHAVTVSRLLEDGVDVRRNHERGVANSRIDIVTAFHLATVGGADLLGIDAGLLTPGRWFDAVAVDIGPDGGLGVDRDIDDWPRVFEKIVRGTGAQAIRAVWVGGRLVSGELPLSSCAPR